MMSSASYEVQGSVVQKFDLVTADWVGSEPGFRRLRTLAAGGILLFGTAFLITLTASVLELSHGANAALAGMAVSVVFGWFLLLTTSRYLYASGLPAISLEVSSSGISVHYPSARNDWSREWSEPKFGLILRDFGGQSPPLPSELVLDTGDHSFKAWLLPTAVPPSAFLTRPAFAAVIEAAKSMGLSVASESKVGLGGSDGWTWFSTVTRIRRAAAAPGKTLTSASQ